MITAGLGKTVLPGSVAALLSFACVSAHTGRVLCLHLLSPGGDVGRVLLFQVELGPQAVDGGEDASEPAPGGGSNVSPDTGGRPC